MNIALKTFFEKWNFFIILVINISCLPSGKFKNFLLEKVEKVVKIEQNCVIHKKCYIKLYNVVEKNQIWKR